MKGLLPDEEKEKIGPKPVLSDAVSASSISKPPSISMPPILAKPAQLTHGPVIAAPPSMPQSRPPLPPGPPGMMAAPAAPVMVIPSGAVPQMPARTPMMGEYSFI